MSIIPYCHMSPFPIHPFLIHSFLPPFSPLSLSLIFPSEPFKISNFITFHH